MPSLIGNMIGTYAIPMQKFACGVTIRIRRNGVSNPPITAIVDEVEEKSQESIPNTTIVAGNRTYDIAVADYKIQGQVSDPKQGDELLETINGRECRHAVMRQSNDVPAFEKSDSDGERWIVRTKRVGDG